MPARVVAAAAAVAAFFSHQAIIDVYFWNNMEGIVDGISNNRVEEKERAAHFLLTLACAPAVPSTFRLLFLFLPYSIGVLLLIMTCIYVRGPR